MTKEENKLRDDLLAEVQENIQKRKACPLHQFEGKKKVAIGEKHVCLNCGWKFYISDIGKYVDGYIAAGGNPDDIYEGLRRPQPTRPQPAIEGDVADYGREIPAFFSEIVEKLEFAARQCELWESCDDDAAIAAIKFRALEYKLKDWMKGRQQ